MKHLKSALIIALIALAATSVAFAGNKQSVNYTASESVQVGAKTLSPGEYTIKITRAGNDAKIVFEKYGKEVATANGVYVTTDNCSADFAVLLDSQSNLTELCGYKFKGGIKLTGAGDPSAASAQK